MQYGADGQREYLKELLALAHAYTYEDELLFGKIAEVLAGRRL
jgi:hypothetical protein